MEKKIEKARIREKRVHDLQKNDYCEYIYLILKNLFKN